MSELNYDFHVNIDEIKDDVFIEIIDFEDEQGYAEQETNGIVTTHQAVLNFDYYGVTEESEKYKIDLTKKQFNQLWEQVYKVITN